MNYNHGDHERLVLLLDGQLRAGGLGLCRYHPDSAGARTACPARDVCRTASRGAAATMIGTHFSSLDWVIVIGYLAATMATGLYGRKFVGGISDFLVAGRELGTFLAVATLAAH